MRINESIDTAAAGISVTTTSAARATERGGSTGRAGQAGSDFDDRVQLSGLAGSLEGLRSDSAARQQEVERLSQVVAAGQYQPEASAIASSIVAEALGGAQG